MMRRIASILMLTALLAAPAAALDEAGDAAAALLRQAVTPRRDGAHETLLTALRRLRDPAMRPLYVALAASTQPSLQLHGLLGQAEIDPAGELPLSAIGELTYAPLQAELIAAAIDESLLSNDAARQLLDWPGLALPVKLVIAARLLETGPLPNLAALEEGLTSDNLGRRGLAGLLLHQLEDPRGVTALSELDASTERGRDAVRAELLRTAARHRFHHAADWAYALATDPEAEDEMRLSALAVAMRFNHPSAAERWKRLYLSHAGNVARQRRLALLLLRVAPWVEPAAFDPLLPGPDAMLADIGRAGRAIASNSADLADRAAALLEHRHPLLNQWALAYARHDARPDVAQFLMLGLIVAYEAGDASDRLDRLDDAAEAALQLMRADPAAGAKLLRPILAEPTTDPLLRQAILLGLLRTEGDNKLGDLVASITFDDRDANQLALVLRARDGAALTDAERDELRLIVRGGTRIQGALRIQAAWTYLRRTDQIDAALARAFAR